jgi:hypothetical protein
MLKMSEWAPQSLGGSMAAGEVLDPKGDEGTFCWTNERKPRFPIAHRRKD